MIKVELYLEAEEYEELMELRERLGDSDSHKTLRKLLDYIQMWKEEHDE